MLNFQMLNHFKQYFDKTIGFKVVFEAGVGKDFQSDIAIDTIHFEDHSGNMNEKLFQTLWSIVSRFKHLYEMCYVTK